jgi:hypothetical protein
VSALILLLLCAAELILFLLPGLAAILLISRKLAILPRYALPLVMAASSAFGYAAFWIYLGNKTAGQSFSYGLIACALAVVAIRRRAASSRVLQPDFCIPLAYTFCLAVFSLSILYLWVNPLRAGVDVANFRFFPNIRAGDNIIPFIFAQRLYDRAPVRPFCCVDWLSSDRPPLQAGIFLLQRPLRVAGNTGLQYQVLGTVLQCVWICGVWTFLRVLGVGRVLAAQGVGLLLFSAFLVYNDVYAWPKLLAACFVLFAFAIIGPAAIERRRLTRIEALLVATCFVLAVLAHPGSVFSAPAFFALLFFRRGMFTWRQAIWTCLIALIGFVPWAMYQKFYDPPGTRLLKMHLAGVIEPDSRGVWQSIRDAYAQLSIGSILGHKISNIATIAGWTGQPWPGLRVAEREYILYTVGLLLIATLIAVCVRRFRPVLAYGSVMIAVAACNLFVWSLVLFGPAQTVTEHGSYADILLLALGLISIVLALPHWARTAIICAQAINLIFVWALYRPASFVLPSRVTAHSSLQWPMLVLAVVFGGALSLAAAFPNALFQKKPQ